MIPFENGRFVASSLKPEEFPLLKDDRGNILPEITFVGRSNVGKSTLINTLLKNKKLAKTSSTPGKTQRINFFVIDEKLLLVDLPGYGYSKASKLEISTWSGCIEEYLNSRTHLKALLLLIDCRRDPNESDHTMAAWAQSKGIPLIVIHTKSDKLRASEKPKEGIAGTESILFSEKDPEARRRLIQLLNRKLL